MRVDHPPKQPLADTGPANADDAHSLVFAVSELGAKHRTVTEPGRVKARDVARERIVLLGPLADPGQPGTEPIRDDVIGIANEDRVGTQPREARDVLDHLRVV